MIKLIVAVDIHRCKTIIMIYRCYSTFFLLTMTNTTHNNAKIKITTCKSNNNYYKMYVRLKIT